MKKQIKHILVGSLFLFLPFTNLHAQEGDSGISFFSENKTTDTNPPGHDSGDDPEGSVPIDDYLPILFITSIAIVIKYQKEILKKVKNNSY
ncbi:MAG TPA: hypothetical protein DEQ26_09730 [Flavobacteriaceae bacterium]|nr:hypothetical protein [Flavobacteriaceae bacterium]